jgi:flagellar biosynthesis/type III secretory pathway protein FliH
MALAVLNLSAAACVASDSRVLSPGQWQAVNDLAALREQAAVALTEARERAESRAMERARAEVISIEQRLQKGALLKALSLQIDFERAQRGLRAQFVQTVMTCLNEMLAPVPPAFFARVQASSVAMIGESSEVALHVAAIDEATAREGTASAPVRVVVDPDLAGGQCFLETRFGRIQAGLPTQLEALQQTLERWWSQENMS